MARMSRNISFLIFLTVVAAMPARIQAGNYCAIFLSSCSMPAGFGDALYYGGCQDSCEDWTWECCAEFCAGQSKEVSFNQCLSDPDCGAAGPQCIACSCG